MFVPGRQTASKKSPDAAVHQQRGEWARQAGEMLGAAPVTHMVLPLVLVRNVPGQVGTGSGGRVRGLVWRQTYTAVLKRQLPH